MRAGLILPLVLLVTSCQQPATHEYSESIAGIDHVLWIVEKDPDKAKRAASAVFSELRLLSEFTHPVKSKPISRTNVLLRSREWFSVNPSMTSILKQAIDYYEKTDGLYNPAAFGGLRERWGWYSGNSKPMPPKESELQQFLADLPTMNDIQFDGIRLRGNNRHIRLDFDWLAYGYAIDMQLQHLRQLGIRDARLRIDRVEMSVGQVPGGTVKPGFAGCQRELPLVSEDTLPVPAHDVIDTRTGHPVDHTRAVKVVATNASDAAVGCWALLVSAADARPQLANRLNLVEADVTATDGTVTRLTGR